MIFLYYEFGLDFPYIFPSIYLVIFFIQILSEDFMSENVSFFALAR